MQKAKIWNRVGNGEYNMHLNEIRVKSPANGLMKTGVSSLYDHAVMYNMLQNHRIRGEKMCVSHLDYGIWYQNHWKNSLFQKHEISKICTVKLII